MPTHTRPPPRVAATVFVLSRFAVLVLGPRYRRTPAVWRLEGLLGARYATLARRPFLRLGLRALRAAHRAAADAQGWNAAPNGWL